MTWPPAWDKPHFKEPGSAKVRRGIRREKRENREQGKKQQVRQRDKYCRFPLCGCKRFQLALEVSHGRHKGAGGNPAEDRSEPESMILLCLARHKENVFSVDRKSLRWRALTPRGSKGPVAWDINVGELRRLTRSALETDSVRKARQGLVVLALAGMGREKWFELARETAIHAYEPTTSEQTAVLAWLRSMEL